MKKFHLLLRVWAALPGGIHSHGRGGIGAPVEDASSPSLGGV